MKAVNFTGFFIIVLQYLSTGNVERIVYMDKAEFSAHPEKSRNKKKAEIDVRRARATKGRYGTTGQERAPATMAPEVVRRTGTMIGQQSMQQSKTPFALPENNSALPLT